MVGGMYSLMVQSLNGEWGDDSEISCRAQWSFASNLAIHTGSHSDHSGLHCGFTTSCCVPMMQGADGRGGVGIEYRIRRVIHAVK
jgi:hypothetical protein